MVEEDIKLVSGTLTLSGTLAMPDSGGPFPTVLLIPGSGQVDRNENHKRLAINALQEIAEYLAGQGIATLRYDKRGVGASEGDYWATGFYDNVADALAVLTQLKAHVAVKSGLVFLLGHSEGAMISIRLAGEGADVAGVILIAGAAKRGEETLKWQAEQVAKGLRGFNKWIIKLFRINVLKSQQKQIDKIRRSSRDWYRVQLIAKINAKWMREFIEYDPGQDLAKINVPVLAITGSKDIQVDPADLIRMGELIKGDFESHELPNVTHLLRVEEGEPTISNYKKQTRQPVDRRILEIVSVWLRNRIEALAQ
jgi:pimeloyl-ACP methyl ester carboxylesterase